MKTNLLLAKSWLILLSIAFTTALPYSAQASCLSLFGGGKLQPGELRAIQDPDGTNPFAHEFGPSKVFGEEPDYFKTYSFEEANALVARLTPPYSWNVKNSEYQRAVHKETIADIIHILEYATFQKQSSLTRSKFLDAQDLLGSLKALDKNIISEELMAEVFEKLKNIIFAHIPHSSPLGRYKHIQIANAHGPKPTVIFSLRPMGNLQIVAWSGSGVFPVGFKTTLQAKWDNVSERSAAFYAGHDLGHLERILDNVRFVVSRGFPLNADYKILKQILPIILTWDTPVKRYLGVGALFQKTHENSILLYVNLFKRFEVNELLHWSFQSYEQEFLARTKRLDEKQELNYLFFRYYDVDNIDINVRWNPLINIIDQVTQPEPAYQ